MLDPASCNPQQMWLLSRLHHSRQIEGDRAHGKMSPLVRLGTKTGTEVRAWDDTLLCFVNGCRGSLEEGCTACTTRAAWHWLVRAAQGASCSACRWSGPCQAQVLKGAVGTTYILAAVLAFTGVLPFSVLTSVIVAYGMAGEMVKLAETNMLSELQLLSCGQEHGLPGPARLGVVQLIKPGGGIGSCSAWMQRCVPCLGRLNRQMCAPCKTSELLHPGVLPRPLPQTLMASRRSSSWPPSGTSPSAPCSCSACCCPRSCDGCKLSAGSCAAAAVHTAHRQCSTLVVRHGTERQVAG